MNRLAIMGLVWATLSVPVGLFVGRHLRAASLSTASSDPSARPVAEGLDARPALATTRGFEMA